MEKYKIKLELDVSQTSTVITITLSDMGYTFDEWQELTEEQKKEAIEQEAFNHPEQPYWCLDKYSEQF